jgi:hypothetical protein
VRDNCRYTNKPNTTLADAGVLYKAFSNSAFIVIKLWALTTPYFFCTSTKTQQHVCAAARRSITTDDLCFFCEEKKLFDNTFIYH